MLLQDARYRMLIPSLNPISSTGDPVLIKNSKVKSKNCHLRTDQILRDTVSKSFHFLLLHFYFLLIQQFKNLFHNLFIIKVISHSFDLLVFLVAFACYQDDIFFSGKTDRCFDRLFPVCYR